MTDVLVFQEPVTQTGEHGGPKGAYAGAEPTRYGKLSCSMCCVETKHGACDDCTGFQEEMHPVCQHLLLPMSHKIPLRTRQMYEV